MATDYRYDQFNDVLETVERVEMHIVPSVSPFVIHLDEVPLRGDPSTIIVREVTGTVEGVKQYGRTFTEVAEPPAQDTFRPDYNTGADGDANWNTGAILFNAADASVAVEVTYQATGTLASIKTNHYPSWWTDRGDGSDGDFYPTADITVSGIKNYASVFVPAGVTVTVSPAALIKCQGAFVNMGTVTADGQGAAGGASARVPSEDNGGTASGNSGDSGYMSVGGAGGGLFGNEGGEGAAGAPQAFGNAVEAEFYRTMLLDAGDLMTSVGSGGGSGAGSYTNKDTGAGGAGGGGILIAAGEAYNGGTISANGAKGEDCSINYNAGGGGGGGGAVIIIARRIANEGIITANGGAAGVNTSNYKPGLAAAGGEGIVVMKEVDGL